MKKLLKKGLAITLVAAMILSITPTSADAAKKPAVKKKVTVKVGKTKKIKVKRAKKKAKVNWKSSKKKVVKVVKGTKKYVKIKGRKKGTARVYTKYKVGKKTYKLSIKVTVKKNTGSTPAPTVPVTDQVITVTSEVIVVVTREAIVATDQATTATDSSIVTGDAIG